MKMTGYGKQVSHILPQPLDNSRVNHITTMTIIIFYFFLNSV